MGIRNTIVNCFGLSEESKERFKEGYDKPFVDDAFGIFLDSSYRIRTPLPESLYESFDKGWETLRSVMPDLVREYDIKYEEFYSNKKAYSKNTFRVIKLIRSFFHTGDFEEKARDFLLRMRSFEERKFYEFERYCRENELALVSKDSITKAIDLFIDRINELRFSKNKSIEIVLSLNREDWFCSTTNESWRTCLSLESPSFASYWVSLAGSVIDKNLALLYITNGDKKEYMGVKTDKVLSRSWVLLDENSIFNIVNFYPSSLLSVDNLGEFLPYKIKKIGNDFVGKHTVSPLWFKNGYSNYIYQDKTIPVMIDDKTFKLKSGSKGLKTIYKGKVFEGPIFNFCDGFSKLKRLVEENRDISILDFFTYPDECVECGSLVSRYRACYNEDDGSYNRGPYCGECFNDNFC